MHLIGLKLVILRKEKFRRANKKNYMYIYRKYILHTLSSVGCDMKENDEALVSDGAVSAEALLLRKENPELGSAFGSSAVDP